MNNITRAIHADDTILAADLEAELEEIRLNERKAEMAALALAHTAQWDAQVAAKLAMRDTQGRPMYKAGGPLGWMEIL